MGRQPNPEDVQGFTPIEDMKTAVNLIGLAVQTMAAPGEVLLRKNFGPKAFGLPSFLALLGIPLWGLMFPDERGPYLAWLWYAFIAMQLRARIESFIRRARGIRTHTRYNGDSRFLPLLGRWISHDNLKGQVEPLFLILAGCCLLPTTEAVGGFLMMSGVCVMGHMTMIVSAQKVRMEQMQDAFMEQQHEAEMFREMQRRFYK